METIESTITKLKETLSDYIKSTYHISNPSLIQQREEILSLAGNIFQESFLETTPRYKSKVKLEQMINLPEIVRETLLEISKSTDQFKNLIFDPLYSHQSTSLEEIINNRKNAVIMTGTGSGKTESFLLPVLSKFLIEANNKPQTFFQKPAVRAMILYPMNALVNDQLGRFRNIFGDIRIKNKFKKLTGRPVRFGRYTGRTLYPGVRTIEKDQRRLKSIDDFYVDTFKKFKNNDPEYVKLYNKLNELGKWPSKPDIEKWYGEGRWQSQEQFRRCVTLSDDSELLTRHEMFLNPPDLLVTNYFMLEYMLIRPIEKKIFEETKNWLGENKEEKFLLVIDEAHMYKGSGGAEVSLLIRRFCSRLDIEPDRLQVVCSTASFNDESHAKKFAATLTGTKEDDFVTITGEFAKKENAEKGSLNHVQVLSNLKLTEIANPNNDTWKVELQSLSNLVKKSLQDTLPKTLTNLLEDYPPLNQLINITMGQAQPVKDLGKMIFEDDSSQNTDLALSNLISLASMTKQTNGTPSLPARIHTFFRGLPGLWICMNPNCSGIEDHLKDGVAGKMYSQPRETCDHCNSRVLEFFTCRSCGAAYARGYKDQVDFANGPTWSNEGSEITIDQTTFQKLKPIDIFLEKPKNENDENLEKCDYDFETGRINPNTFDDQKTRIIYLSKKHEIADDRIFRKCVSCKKSRNQGNQNLGILPTTNVENHQTKGDEPFRTLVNKQLEIQPENYDVDPKFSPLKGRKVMVFSDSRQIAARLAAKLQELGIRDIIRAMVAFGFKFLEKIGNVNEDLNLDDINFAVAVSAHRFNIKLKAAIPEDDTYNPIKLVEEVLGNVNYSDLAQSEVNHLRSRINNQRIPSSLLDHIFSTVFHYGHLSLEQLAIATLKETKVIGIQLNREINNFPNLPNIAETSEQKIDLIRIWLRLMSKFIKHKDMDYQEWMNKNYKEGYKLEGHKHGKFQKIKKLLGNENNSIFEESWLEKLINKFCESYEDQIFLLCGNVTFNFSNEWMSCTSCKNIFRKDSILKKCLDCNSDEIETINIEENSTFKDRKGYYRKPVIELLNQIDSPDDHNIFMFISEEHTAQLNATQDNLFSEAEYNELGFQDIDTTKLGRGTRASSVDVLSCTTTMEVGIDIGSLLGVGLRNMPPARANYQQRAGRAGRRGSAIATVIAYGNTDNHDEYYFSNPKELISGRTEDPFLTLDNKEIVKRHILAFLLQNYQNERTETVDPANASDLFSHLGLTNDFFSGEGDINLQDFKNWLKNSISFYQSKIKRWIPTQLACEIKTDLIENLYENSIQDLESSRKEIITAFDETNMDQSELPEETGNTFTTTNKNYLLEHLNFCGKLPKYAMPNDVASLSIFSKRTIKNFEKPEIKFEPSQSIHVALSAYAPGKRIWVDKKNYISGAIYSVFDNERIEAWRKKAYYLECQYCGFAEKRTDVSVGYTEDCRACGSSNSLGPAQIWVRPNGFAHPVDIKPETKVDDYAEVSYATRAKFYTNIGEDDSWVEIKNNIKFFSQQTQLLITNTGPNSEGYTYCKACGRIKQNNQSDGFNESKHTKPFPTTFQEKDCNSENQIVHGLVLGCDFFTDIALFRIKLNDKYKLPPGSYSTKVVLRTVCEALKLSATRLLEIDQNEIEVEYRPALTRLGQSGKEFEIFSYDTLPGGAGFSPMLKNFKMKLFKNALSILNSCASNCNSSCYKCLQSFKNKHEHIFLDRHAGKQLLEFLISNDVLEMDVSRLKNSYEILYSDLSRQIFGDANDPKYQKNIDIQDGGLTFTAPILINFNNKKFIVCLSNSLSNERPIEKEIDDYLATGSQNYEVVTVPEILIRKNLPSASKFVNEKIGFVSD